MAASCVVKRINRTRICVGDLNKRITLYDRSIEAPGFEGFNFREDFTDGEKKWAAIDNVKGMEVFDGVDTTDQITHPIRCLSANTSQSWNSPASQAAAKIQISSSQTSAIRPRSSAAISDQAAA